MSQLTLSSTATLCCPQRSWQKSQSLTNKPSLLLKQISHQVIATTFLYQQGRIANNTCYSLLCLRLQHYVLSKGRGASSTTHPTSYYYFASSTSFLQDQSLTDNLLKSLHPTATNHFHNNFRLSARQNCKQHMSQLTLSSTATLCHMQRSWHKASHLLTDFPSYSNRLATCYSPCGTAAKSWKEKNKSFLCHTKRAPFLTLCQRLSTSHSKSLQYTSYFCKL